uniref:Uncharacterized protein n=1 Tax=Arundo donax TaxID=35708 RepID=A0A0A9HF90_ARUDO
MIVKADMCSVEFGLAIQVSTSTGLNRVIGGSPRVKLSCSFRVWQLRKRVVT